MIQARSILSIDEKKANEDSRNFKELMSLSGASYEDIANDMQVNPMNLRTWVQAGMQEDNKIKFYQAVNKIIKEKQAALEAVYKRNSDYIEEMTAHTDPSTDKFLTEDAKSLYEALLVLTTIKHRAIVENTSIGQITSKAYGQASEGRFYKAIALLKKYNYVNVSNNKGTGTNTYYLIKES